MTQAAPQRSGSAIRQGGHVALLGCAGSVYLGTVATIGATQATVTIDGELQAFPINALFPCADPDPFSECDGDCYLCGSTRCRRNR